MAEPATDISSRQAGEAGLMDLDADRTFIVSAFGSKGSGKSTINRMIYRDFDGPKLCIDVNGDADPGPEAARGERPKPGEVQRIYELEDRMPAQLDTSRPAPNLHYVADPGSPSYEDDIDRAMGMAMFPTDTPSLVWAGEIGEFRQGHRSGPHARRLAQQNRHYKTSVLVDGPRPKNIDPLWLTQSDYVVIFDLPNPADRDRVAETIGYPPTRFDRECEETFRRGEHWFLMWDAKAKRLTRHDPIPMEWLSGSAPSGV